MRPKTITCEKCGTVEPVNPKGRVSKFCASCRPARHRVPATRQCDGCGVECSPRERRRLYTYCNRCVEIGRAKRDTSLRQRYGITLTQYEELWARQGGCCGICGKDLNEVHAVCTDHDHGTDKVRGLLCHHCNRALGAFGDDREGVLRVLRYLEKPPAGFIHEGVDTLTHGDKMG